MMVRIICTFTTPIARTQEITFNRGMTPPQTISTGPTLGRSNRYLRRRGQPAVSILLRGQLGSRSDRSVDPWLPQFADSAPLMQTVRNIHGRQEQSVLTPWTSIQSPKVAAEWLDPLSSGGRSEGQQYTLHARNRAGPRVLHSTTQKISFSSNISIHNAQISL